MVAHPSTRSTYQERRGHRVLMTRSLLANKGNDNGSQRIKTVDQKKKGDSSSSLASHFRIAQPYLQYHPCNLLYVNLRIPHTVTGCTSNGHCRWLLQSSPFRRVSFFAKVACVDAAGMPHEISLGRPEESATSVVLCFSI